MDGGKIAPFSPVYAGLFSQHSPQKSARQRERGHFANAGKNDKSPSPVSQDKRLLTQNNDAALSAIAS